MFILSEQWYFCSLLLSPYYYCVFFCILSSSVSLLQQNLFSAATSFTLNYSLIYPAKIISTRIAALKWILFEHYHQISETVPTTRCMVFIFRQDLLSTKKFLRKVMITMFRDLQMLTRKGLEQPEAILNLALLSTRD